MNNIFKSLLIIAFFTACISVNAQDETESDNFEIKSFGVGMHVEQFKVSEIFGNNVPDPVAKVKFIFSVPNFRIEPHFGYASQKDENDDYPYRTIAAGVGAYYTMLKGKTNIYTGLNFGLASSASKFDLNGETEKFFIKTTSLGPVLGAEYFLGNNFSFGGEVNLMYVKGTDGDTINPANDQVDTVISTNSGLLLRFYF